jgi:hypothetical protein
MPSISRTLRPRALTGWHCSRHRRCCRIRNDPLRHLERSELPASRPWEITTTSLNVQLTDQRVNDCAQVSVMHLGADRGDHLIQRGEHKQLAPRPDQLLQCNMFGSAGSSAATWWHSTWTRPVGDGDRLPAVLTTLADPGEKDPAALA